MLGRLTHPLRQLAHDATLRRWLVLRAVGRATAPPAFIPHAPPYLAGLRAPNADPTNPIRECDCPTPDRPLALDLPGKRIEISPAAPEQAFARPFADTETLLALHRFAWIPILGDHVDPAWVAALWRTWQARFFIPDHSWAWHPYTAAERAVNLLRFARRHGLPALAGNTRDLLARHAPAIVAGLEYFGDHNTSNHLSNNGRGLFILGLELGMADYAHIGARILTEESRRIFLSSGVLREGSSHYHLLLTRNYAEAWLAARRHGHTAATGLESILARALGVIPHLFLSGGLPLVGDISPDCPPAHLAAFLPGDPATTGWGALLDDDERAAFLAIKSRVVPADRSQLALDGWAKFESSNWSGLWHLAPGGFSPMPGHGHQDAGAFEVHWRGLPLFVDLGRGAYGDDGAAAHYRSALVHNGLTLDDRDPYPPNKPYYDDAFRRRAGGLPPELKSEADGVSLTFGGYGRLDAPVATRRWRFLENEMTIEDGVDGRGHRRIARRLHTSWPVEIAKNSARIRMPVGDIFVRADGVVPTVRPAIRWSAYGEGGPASAIVLETPATLPWNGVIRVEAL